MWLMALKFHNPYRKPPKLWPVVIDYFIVPDEQRFIDGESEFKKRLGMEELPIGYTICRQMISDKPAKQQSVKVILAGRLRRLRERVEKKWPLFAEDIIAEQINLHPDEYNPDKIVIEQAEKTEFERRYRSLEFMVPLVIGHDSWKTYNHKRVREYLVRRRIRECQNRKQNFKIQEVR